MADISTTAFNNMLLEFVDELEMTFKDETALPGYNLALKTLVATNKEQPVKLFAEHLGPHCQRIMQQDESLLAEVPELLGGIDVHKLVTTASQDDKNTVWTWLKSLTMMSVAISSLPPEMMNTLAQTAQQLSTSEQASGGVPALSAMIGAMGGMGGIGGIMSSVFGALGQSGSFGQMGGQAGSVQAANPSRLESSSKTRMK